LILQGDAESCPVRRAEIGGVLAAFPDDFGQCCGIKNRISTNFDGLVLIGLQLCLISIGLLFVDAVA